MSTVSAARQGGATLQAIYFVDLDTTAETSSQSTQASYLSRMHFACRPDRPIRNYLGESLTPNCFLDGFYLYH
jgi:hypothetical protein